MDEKFGVTSKIAKPDNNLCAASFIKVNQSFKLQSSLQIRRAKSSFFSSPLTIYKYFYFVVVMLFSVTYLKMQVSFSFEY